MKYSKMFGKTVKDTPSGASIASHKLLYQGGFIRKSVAGRYFILPIGMRVRDKIMNIIEEEMDKTGAQKMISPVMHPLELWRETNRTNTAGFELTEVKDRRGGEFALGGTGEEMFTDVVRKYQLSYKDLPFNIYQFSPKFRDELRAKGGLMRVREFIMKDAYSFHVDEEDFLSEYDIMSKTYKTIFQRVGLSTVRVLADNGYIGGEYCHEYVVDSEAGESVYFHTEDMSYVAHEDVAEFTRDEVNMDEEMKPFEIIEQPKWVQTMEDSMKHYDLPKSRFLKNVVYRHRVTGDIIIAGIRGDLEVNKTKLEHVIDAVGQLEDATDEDLAKLGTKSGYVHSWGHKGARYIGDLSLKSVRNFIGGQKEDKTDSFNVNYGRDFECEVIADIALVKDGFVAPDGKSKLAEKKGVEVGNIFQLGYHYSSKMKATYINNKGKGKEFYMGCYGIGIGRTLATIVEMHNDEQGIMWPMSVAPYQVHLVSLGTDNTQANDLYEQLLSEGIEVLWDDRLKASPGEKFADSDLLGVPIRIVLSERSLKNGGVEVKMRNSKDSEIVAVEKIAEFLKSEIAKQLEITS